jgi:Protein kinase domain
MWSGEASQHSESASSSSSSSSVEDESSSYTSDSDISCVNDAENGYSNNTFGGGGEGSGAAMAVRRRNAPSSGNHLLHGKSRSSGPNGSETEDNNNDNDNDSKMNRSDDKHSPSHRRRHYHKSRHILSKLWRALRRNRHLLGRHLPTFLLVSCFIFWVLVQTFNVYDSIQQSTHSSSVSSSSLQNQQRRQQDFRKNSASTQKKTRHDTLYNYRRGSSRLEEARSFMTDAVDGFMDIVGFPVKAFRQSRRGEELLPGCHVADWQLFNLPNCNDMHETDLATELLLAFNKENKNINNSSHTNTNKNSGGGYVGSGYWRQVWLVFRRQPQEEERAVLKMMKSEHKVDSRNFERHRRDALAMERLTSSPNIVDMYAYCGNSVLTEYVGSDLHRVLYPANNMDDELPPDQRPSPELVRTDRETLELALGIARGVAALHQVPGGPIVHADIADKQYLIDEKGQVKLNDFNRCRFMGHYDEEETTSSSSSETNNKCTFRIPSAPGRHRSPEEYEDKELTEQLDTYSTANVLYGVLTGTEPWAELPSSQVKRAVKHGLKPPIDEKFRVPGTINAMLADLVEQAYEHDPLVRITAPALVAELEMALAALPSEAQ